MFVRAMEWVERKVFSPQANMVVSFIGMVWCMVMMVMIGGALVRFLVG